MTKLQSYIATHLGREFRKAALLSAAGTLAIALPTPTLAAPDSEIGIAKSVGVPVLAPDGTVSVEYTIIVSNPNSFDIENVQVIDDFTAIPGVAAATIVSANVTSSVFSVDHTGVADQILLDGTDELVAGASGTITARLVFQPNGEAGPFFNSADVNGDTVCTVGTATTQGLAISHWDLPGPSVPSATIELDDPLSFKDGPDANGFNTLSSPIPTTGFSRSAATLLVGNNVPASNDPEGATGLGWIAPPCAGTSSIWELRVLMGRSVATYLAALAVDAVPSSSNIITSGGTDGFQQTAALFSANVVSESAPFTADLSAPTGIFLQVDDRGSGYRFALQERIDGGAWTSVPLSRVWAEKPVGNEVGARAVSDTSDNGNDPNPASTNGAGGVDDPTPVVLPTPNPRLAMTKVADDDAFVTVGQLITYTYTVTNIGDINVRNVKVDDIHNGDGQPPLPTNETLLTDNDIAGDSTDGTPGDGTWDLLAPLDVITFTGTYTVEQADIDNLQ